MHNFVEKEILNESTMTSLLAERGRGPHDHHMGLADGEAQAAVRLPLRARTRRRLAVGRELRLLQHRQVHSCELNDERD